MLFTIILSGILGVFLITGGIFYLHYHYQRKRYTKIYVEEAEKKIIRSVKLIEKEGLKENEDYEKAKRKVVEWEKKIVQDKDNYSNL